MSCECPFGPHRSACAYAAPPPAAPEAGELDLLRELERHYRDLFQRGSKITYGQHDHRCKAVLARLDTLRSTRGER